MDTFKSWFGNSTGKNRGSTQRDSPNIPSMPDQYNPELSSRTDLSTHGSSSNPRLKAKADSSTGLSKDHARSQSSLGGRWQRKSTADNNNSSNTPRGHDHNSREQAIKRLRHNDYQYSQEREGVPLFQEDKDKRDGYSRGGPAPGKTYEENRSNETSRKLETRLSLREENERLQENLNHHKEAMKRLQDGVEEVRNDMKRQEGEIQGLKSHNKQQEDEMQGLKNLNKQQQDEVQDLKNLNKQREIEIQDLKDGKKVLQKDLVGLHEEKQKVEKRFTSLETGYETLEKNYNELVANYNLLRKNYLENGEMLKRLDKDKKQLQQDKANLESSQRELLASNQKMQKTIVEYTSRGGIEQRDDNYFTQQFASLSSSINQWSTTNFVYKSAVDLIDRVGGRIPKTSVFYHGGQGLQRVTEFFTFTGADVEYIFSDASSSLPRTKVINGAIYVALGLIHSAHFPFIGMPEYREQLLGLSTLCGGSAVRERQRLTALATNLIVRSEEFSLKQNAALEQVTAELDSFFAPLASPKSDRDPDKRRSRLLKIMQKFAQLVLELAQQDALYAFINIADSQAVRDGILFEPSYMACTDGLDSDKDLVEKEARVQIIESPAIYKHGFKSSGDKEEDPVLISPMRVSCIGVPKEKKVPPSAHELTQVQENRGGGTAPNPTRQIPSQAPSQTTPQMALQTARQTSRQTAPQDAPQSAPQTPSQTPSGVALQRGYQIVNQGAHKGGPYRGPHEVSQGHQGAPQGVRQGVPHRDTQAPQGEVLLADSQEVHQEVSHGASEAARQEAYQEYPKEVQVIEVAPGGTPNSTPEATPEGKTDHYDYEEDLMDWY